MDLLRPKLTVLQEQMNTKLPFMLKKRGKEFIFYVNKIYLR